MLRGSINFLSFSIVDPQTIRKKINDGSTDLIFILILHAKSSVTGVVNERNEGSV